MVRDSHGAFVAGPVVLLENVYSYLQVEALAARARFVFAVQRGLIIFVLRVISSDRLYTWEVNHDYALHLSTLVF